MANSNSAKANQGTQDFGSTCNLHVTKFGTWSCNPLDEGGTLLGTMLDAETFLVTEGHLGEEVNVVKASDVAGISYVKEGAATAKSSA